MFLFATLYVAAETYIELDVSWLNKVVALFLPLLVGVVTKKVSSSGLKATLLFVLSAVSGLVTTMIQADGRVPLEQVIDAMVNTLVVAVAMYYGVWKPTGIAGTVTEKTARFGFGSPPAPLLETADKGQEDVGEAVAEVAAVVETVTPKKRPPGPRQKVEKKAPPTA